MENWFGDCEGEIMFKPESFKIDTPLYKGIPVWAENAAFIANKEIKETLDGLKIYITIEILKTLQFYSLPLESSTLGLINKISETIDLIITSSEPERK